MSQQLHATLQRWNFLTLAQNDPAREQNFRLPRVSFVCPRFILALARDTHPNSLLIRILTLPS